MHGRPGSPAAQLASCNPARLNVELVKTLCPSMRLKNALPRAFAPWGFCGILFTVRINGAVRTKSGCEKYKFWEDLHFLQKYLAF